METHHDVNENNNGEETQNDVNVKNDAMESVNAANVNNKAVAPKDAVDGRAGANDPSGDESSTNTVADHAASIGVDNLAAAIANATNARRPAPTPLYITITNVYKAS